MNTFAADGGSKLVREIAFKEWIAWGQGRAYPLEEATFELRERQEFARHGSRRGCAVPGSRVLKVPRILKESGGQT